MASRSIILGTIPGISLADFKQLKAPLNDHFSDIAWKNKTLFIHSEGQHPRLKEIFTRIAGCVAEGAFGSLLYVGDQKVACIYFGHKNFEAKLFQEPKPPAWWIAAPDGGEE